MQVITFLLNDDFYSVSVSESSSDSSGYRGEPHMFG